MGGNLKRYRRAKFCKIQRVSALDVVRSVLYAFNDEMSINQTDETYSEGFARGLEELSALSELSP